MTGRSWLVAVAPVALALASIAPAHAAPPQASRVTVTRVPVDSPHHLRGISFVDAQHGYAVGSFGTVIVTDDGGASWRTQPLPPIDSLGDDAPGGAGKR